MTLDRFLQHVLPRDIARAWQDSSAPVAMTIAERPGVSGDGAGFPVPDDAPIPFSLAALRACRGDDSLLRRSPADDEALVQAVVSGVLDEFREQPTNRLRRKLGDGVRRGLRRAGVVR